MNLRWIAQRWFGRYMKNSGPTTSPGPKTERLDEFEHFRLFDEAGISNTRAFKNAIDSMNILAEGLVLIGDLPTSELASNTLGAAACVRSCVVNLRSCVYLVMWGYYAEARIVLRTAYETASLGRYLAKDLDVADKWIRRNTWIPDGNVTTWLSKTGQIDEETKRLYGKNYGLLSSWAHPKSETLLAFLDVSDNKVSFPIETQLRPDVIAVVLEEIAVFGALACYLLRNSAATDAAWPPEWVRSIDRVFLDVSKGQAVVDRDWERLKREHDYLEAKVQTVAQTEEMLKSHPMSIRNLTSEGMNEKDQTGDEAEG